MAGFKTGDFVKEALGGLAWKAIAKHSWPSQENMPAKYLHAICDSLFRLVRLRCACLICVDVLHVVLIALE